MKLRAGVVGVGHLGRWHAQKYKMIDEVELIGVCDTSSDQAQKVAGELGVKPYTQLESLIKDGVQAVTVAASTPAHYSLVKKLLENRIHVLVEKPIASTSSEAIELCDLADKMNVKLQVGHVERFNPAFEAAREKITAPRFIEVHRLAPFKVRSTEVDVVLDLMIHDLDVVLSLVKSEPVHVSAVGSPVLTKVLDLANARIEFQNGAVANLTASRVSQNAQRKFRVFQPDQYVSMDFQAGELNILTKTGEWTGDELPIDHQQYSLEKGDALLTETKAFVDSVVNDRAVLVSGRDGLRALRLAEAIIENARKRIS